MKLQEDREKFGVLKFCKHLKNKTKKNYKNFVRIENFAVQKTLL